VAKTGEHLKIKPMGDAVLGVELEGRPEKPEPTHFRVTFPGGEIDVTRIGDGDYWVHVSAHHKGHGNFYPDEIPGCFVDARLDCLRKHAAEVKLGDFGREDLYHVALRLKVKRGGND